MTASAAERRRDTHDHNRARILAAARTLLVRNPHAPPSVRAIADAAGYTPGALYSYFPSKQDLQGALVAELLAEAGRAVRRGMAGADGADAAVRAGTRALYDRLRSHRGELGIVLRLLDDGDTPLSSTVERQLNGRLIGVLTPIAEALMAGGLGVGAANRATVMLLGQVAGLLLLDQSGRLGVLGLAADDLLERQLDMLLVPRRRNGDTA